MRIAHFADLHLDRPFRWAGHGKGRLLRNRLRETLSRIVEVAVEQQVDAVFGGGDLYEHDLLTPDTEAFLVSTLAGLDGIPVYLAPGNHDYFCSESAYARASWSSNVHIFTESSLEPIELVDGLTLWGAAHRAPASTRGFLEGFQNNRTGTSIALFHGSERGWFSDQEDGKEPHAPFALEQVSAAGLSHLFAGHYHRPKLERMLTYPGNPHPLSFGEAGDRGLVIATVSDDGHVERSTIDVSPTRSHDIVIDITGTTNNSDVRAMLFDQLASLDGMVRATIVGELAPQTDLTIREFDDIAPHLDALVIRDGGIRPGYDLDMIAREETIRGEFVTDVLESDLADEDREAVLLIGLRALEGRSDLGVP